MKVFKVWIVPLSKFKETQSSELFWCTASKSRNIKGITLQIDVQAVNSIYVHVQSWINSQKQHCVS